MPISFTLIIILIIFLLIYKKLPNIKISTTVLITFLIMLVLGFFVQEANVFDKFFVNIIFLSISVFLLAEFMFKNKPTQTGVAFAGSTIIAFLYFIIAKTNTDYLTFLNYVPMMSIVIVSSLFFVKYLQTGFIFILFSYLFIELLNYITFANTIGILRLYSTEFIDALVISLSVFYFVSACFAMLFKKAKKTKHKKASKQNNAIYDK